MYIRLLYGRDKGEIRDIEPGSAIELVKQGRAENPYIDKPAPVITAAEQVAEVVPVVIGTKVKRPRSRA
jgi:hypothetical protein